MEISFSKGYKRINRPWDLVVLEKTKLFFSKFSRLGMLDASIEEIKISGALIVNWLIRSCLSLSHFNWPNGQLIICQQHFRSSHFILLVLCFELLLEKNKNKPWCVIKISSHFYIFLFNKYLLINKKLWS